MEHPGDQHGPDRDDLTETDVDDAFRAVLEGIRTTLPGVQVLFGFLLILPFQSSFEGLTTSERSAFFLAFFGSAIASVLLIAPSVHQRMRAPRSGVRRRSRAHLRFTVEMTIAGTMAFAVALAAAVYLVSSIVLETPTAAIVTASIALLVVWAWFFVPLVAFRESSRGTTRHGDP